MDYLDLPSEDEDRAFAVRPYAVTGGRTRGAQQHLPVEALVRSHGGSGTDGLPPERRRILELTREQFLSVAELSAHLELPVGVIRVLVGDLAQSGQLTVHGLAPRATAAPATSLSVLESVLDGISSL